MNEIPHDLENYLASEKMDGVRARWDGENFITRHGNLVNCPDWFKEGMPDANLDGELWMGRGTFAQLQSVMQTKGSDWSGIKFMIFDYAILRFPTCERVQMLSALNLPTHVELIPHFTVTSEELNIAEETIIRNGGEGLCLRHKDENYRPNNFIKVKRLFPDLERWQG